MAKRSPARRIDITPVLIAELAWQKENAGKSWYIVEWINLPNEDNGVRYSPMYGTHEEVTGLFTLPVSRPIPDFSTAYHEALKMNGLDENHNPIDPTDEGAA